MLEEYEHAVSRGAKIYAELAGYGCTCDAYHVTAPHPEAEGGARAIRDAVEETGMQEETRVYINAHGTSTPLNDKAETVAIKKAYGEKAKQVLVSSTKSMTGHMLGAAGAAEAIAAVLALREGIVPPTIGLNEPTPSAIWIMCRTPRGRRIWRLRFRCPSASAGIMRALPLKKCNAQYRVFLQACGQAHGYVSHEWLTGRTSLCQATASGRSASKGSKNAFFK